MIILVIPQWYKENSFINLLLRMLRWFLIILLPLIIWGSWFLVTDLSKNF